MYFVHNYALATCTLFGVSCACMLQSFGMLRKLLSYLHALLIKIQGVSFDL